MTIERNANETRQNGRKRKKREAEEEVEPEGNERKSSLRGRDEEQAMRGGPTSPLAGRRRPGDEQLDPSQRERHHQSISSTQGRARHNDELGRRTDI
jgi:hypothetical protein